jgi:hypothetical protein
VSKFGVFSTRLTMGVIVIADLDSVLIALDVELTDRIIPSLGFTRSGPGQRPEVTGRAWRRQGAVG